MNSSFVFNPLFSMLWLEIKGDQILHLEDRTEEKPKTDSKRGGT